MTALLKPMKDTYFGLVRRFPLVPIRTEAHYDAAVEFLRPLVVRNERTLDSGERAFLAALTQFIEDYERDHHQIETAKLTPIDALKHLMQLNDMKAVDLGKLLGSRSLASQVLSGMRGLSKRHILVLAERFRVEPGLFLAADE